MTEQIVRQLAGVHAQAILASREARARQFEDRVQHYPQDYETFIEEVLGVTLTQSQRDICAALREYKRVAIKSCHGSGKTYFLAAFVIAFLHIHKESKCITTGPGGTQIRTGIWQDIRRMHKNALQPLIGAPFTTRWEIEPAWFALGYRPSPTQAGRIQGHHAPHMLVVVDEAAEVEQEIYEALDSLMTSDNSTIVMPGNPTRITGPFYNAFTRNKSRWKTMTIEAKDTPNIQAGKEVVPGLITQTWIDEVIAEHGIDSPFVQSRVFARFPKKAGGAYVPLDWIERAQERVDVEPGVETAIEIGIDIARSGADSSVLVARQGEFVMPPLKWQDPDLMGTVGRILTACAELREARSGEQANGEYVPGEIGLVKVDMGGMGAGVLDRLKELHSEGTFQAQDIIGVNFGGRPNDTTKFVNVVDEMWWTLRTAFHNNEIWGTLHDELIEELTSRVTVPASGKTHPHLESKEQFKKRIKRSPDMSDAYAMAFWSPTGVVKETAAPVGIRQSSPWAGSYGEQTWR